MAQVVRPQGLIGPLVVTVIGVILLFNGVPALFQWIGWVAQTAVVIGVEGALDTALVPLMLAGGASFVGFLMLRGGFGALRSLARGATQRAQAQVRGGVQQVRREAGQRYDDVRQEVGQRYGEARAQAEHLQPSSQQGWFERIESLGRQVEAERARRSGQPVAAQQPPRRQQQRPQQAPQQAPQQRAQQPPQQRPLQQQQRQQQRPPQPQRQPQPAQQRAPGGERLGRIEELRQRVDSRVQQAVHLQDAGTQAANRVRQAAHDEAARVQQRQLPNPSDDVTALIGRLDRADGERVRRHGSSLTRSSLTTSSLSKTSLRLDSLLARRH